MRKIISILLSIIILSGLFMTVSAAEVDLGTKISMGETAYFSVEVSENGKYTALVEYAVSDIRGSSIECGLSIDGVAANKGATYTLDIIYSLGKVSIDNCGNELTPEWFVNKELQKGYFVSETAFYEEKATFELTSGAHSVGITLKDGEIYVKSVTFIACDEIPSYDEYVESSGIKKENLSVKPLTVQAESVNYATSKVILPFCDASSAHVTSAADKLQVMNAVGGDAWKLIGQEAIWEIDVKQSGWYAISIRYRQDYTDGRATVRELKIDGETPFKECEQIEFPYVTKWDNIEFGDDSEKYAFYLEKGTHTISLTPVLGEMGDILFKVQEILSELNSIYRKIIMITSSTPDAYRDYRLEEKIPDTIEKLKTEASALQKLIDVMPEGTNSSLLERTVDQMLHMYKHKNSIAGELSNFQSNLSSIGTWISDQKTQSLALDEITVYPENYDYKKESVNFFEAIWYQIKRFLYSFIDEYNVSESYNENIEVWVTTGRDQMQIIRRLANESFTPETDISADLKIINASALLPAVVAGIGPDAALGEANTTPVNFATRGAMYDLNRFKDIDKITPRFAEAALTPLEFDGGLYALPETLNFNMLFYRTDIFEEYGWSVPETWDDVRNLIFELSKNNMQFGLTSGFTTYCMMLAQNGGTVYSEDGTYSTLDELPAIKAFEDYTQLYSEYKIPVSFNFANRFRSGEMPIAITGYTAYNTLEVFAPEIKGLWDIALVPGTADENNVVNHLSTADGACCFILADTKKADASWEFLKWWTSADIQAKYGNAVEDKLGGSARYAPANIEAISEIPWSTSFYNELSTQLENVIGIPEVPGGYFTPRNFNNAFRTVVYEDTDARETLLEYVEIINNEVTRKRKEFGLSVKE